MTLSECRSELRSIISELESIESGVRRDFTGIGEQLCGDCLSGVISKYESVLRRLNNVNYNRLAGWIIRGD